MRILYAVNDLRTGGAERQLIMLVRNMAEKHEVHLVTLWDRGALKRELDSSVKYYSLDFGNRNFLKVFRDFLKLIDKIRPDIVHTRLFYISFICKLAVFFRKFRLIASQESNDNWRNPVINLIDGVLDTNVDLYIGVSREVCENLKKNLRIRKKGKIIYIPNGINITSEKHIFNGGRLGFLGRNSFAKGLDIFLDIMKKTEEEDYIVWTDKYCGNEKNIVTGRTDIRAFFQKADILVITSRWEGFPVTVLEAGVYKVPVISNTENGIRSVFKDNILYYSNFSEFCEIIERLRNDREFYLEYSERISSFIRDNFSDRKICGKFDIIYKKVQIEG